MMTLKLKFSKIDAKVRPAFHHRFKRWPFYFAAAALLALVLAALAAVTACADSPSQAPVPLQSLDIITGAGQAVTLQVEIADTPEERARGLSGRPELPANQGMLFVIDEYRSGFWMKDTALPLSIAFVSAEGLILDIQDMEPYSLAIHNIQEPYSYALEVNQGWYDRHGIAAGDVVQLPPLSSPQ